MIIRNTELRIIFDWFSLILLPFNLRRWPMTQNTLKALQRLPEWRRNTIPVIITTYFVKRRLFKLNSLYPVLEDAERSEADSTHGEASNH